MKKKKLKHKNLQSLIKEWDKKLKDSGFKDIEDRKRDTLKSWAGTSYLVFNKDQEKKIEPQRDYGYSTLTWKESQAEYFRIAGHILYEAEFESEQHRLIWQAHAEGLSQVEIAKKLKLTVMVVRWAIQKMAREFGLSNANKH